MEGYDILYNGGEYNKSDGVIVYIRDSVNYFNFKTISIGDSKAIQLKLNVSRETILITAIYRSPATDPSNFTDELRRYLQGVGSDEDCAYQLITGDININILNETDKVTSDYLNLLAEFNFVSLINKITRPPISCYDHIFVKSKYQIKPDSNCQAVILQSAITDHFSTFAFLDLFVDALSYSRVRCIKRIDYKSLKLKLSSTDWTDLRHGDPQEAATAFLRTLKLSVAECEKLIYVKKKTG